VRDRTAIEHECKTAGTVNSQGYQMVETSKYHMRWMQEVTLSKANAAKLQDMFRRGQLWLKHKCPSHYT